jgi:membrane protease subunit HflC
MHSHAHGHDHGSTRSGEDAVLGARQVTRRAKWILGFIAVLWVGSCCFTVNEEEKAVVLFFGRPVRVYDNAGLKLKLPLPFETVARVDKRLLIYDSLATEYLTKDKKNIIAQCYAVWNVTDPSQLLRRVGDRSGAEQKLDEHIASALGAGLAQYDFDELVNTDPEKVKLDELLGKVKDNLDQTIADRSYGFVIDSIRFTRLSYPDATLDAVFRRMQAERKTIAETYRAEGTKEATVIKSKADLDKEKLLADARQKADKIRGDAEHEAASIYAESYNASPDFYRYWRKLKAMEKVIDENTTIYMTPDVDLFSPLISPPPGH